MLPATGNRNADVFPTPHLAMQVPTGDNILYFVHSGAQSLGRMTEVKPTPQLSQKIQRVQNKHLRESSRSNENMLSEQTS